MMDRPQAPAEPGVPSSRARRGLVLGGGAALGAYQGGALKALREHGIAFEVISATSIGTLHALAWNIGDLILEIDQHWLGNVTRLRPFQPGRLLKGQSPFRFRSSLDQLFDAYRDDYPEGTDPVEIVVALTEVETRSLRVFSTWDPRFSREDRELIHKASTVMPHLGFETVALGGKHYFDGGFLNNLPIFPLAGRGLDEIWLIPLFPLRTASRLSRALELHYPTLRLLSSNPLLSSLLGIGDQMIHPIDLERIQERTVVVAPRSWLRAALLFQPVHALTFSKRNIRRLLELGYQDGQRICRRYLAGSK